ncbi:MAG: PEP-CTERM sorting domain-containing protein [Armatimonadetes bacterium]|nr:PEP-CTERM sorting domain-containing protein [Armatimonadota bacterium]
MKLTLSLIIALAVIALCSTSAFAVGPFSMTYGPGAAPGTWIYTLINNDAPGGDVIPLYLDIYWDPAVASDYFTVVGAPAGWVVNPAYDFPAFDAVGNDPGPGEKLKGFEIAAPTPALFFTAYYSVLGEEQTPYDGVAVPEPGSMMALLGGVASLGAMIRRRRA